MSPTEKIADLNDKSRKGLLPGSTKVLLTTYSYLAFSKPSLAKGSQ